MHPPTTGEEVPEFAEHFSSLEAERDAARLGMWLFLATEVLLFAGLFACYSVYRFIHPEIFARASAHLDVVLGTVNTVVLITSSYTVALAVDFAKQGKNRRVVWLLLASLGMGFCFLGIKAVEYSHKFHEGALPGRFYRLADLPDPAGALFFSLYFIATGLHALHVMIGMGVLGWAAWRAGSGRVTPRRFGSIELAGMYWHLVDLVWIFLYPLLYLLG